MGAVIDGINNSFLIINSLKHKSDQKFERMNYIEQEN
jgi:hypothetical protein